MRGTGTHLGLPRAIHWIVLAGWFIGLPSLVCAAAPSRHQRRAEPSSPAGGQSGSLGMLARQVRAERARSERQQPPPVYTNRNIPLAGHISVFGRVSATPAPRAAVAAGTASRAKARAAWRKRVAAARHQLALDQRALSVNQRELNLSQMQYYSNPNVALRQQYSRSDIQHGAAKVKDLQQKIQADQQRLKELQDAEPPPQP